VAFLKKERRMEQAPSGVVTAQLKILPFFGGSLAAFFLAGAFFLVANALTPFQNRCDSKPQ
jgi:hypothetical protein